MKRWKMWLLGLAVAAVPSVAFAANAGAFGGGCCPFCP
jgi:hypothetical protein